MDNARNFAKVTVDAQGYDDVETVVNLITGNGARLPTVPFNAVWWNSTDYPDPADDPFVEIVRVTAIATDTLTVARGEEGPSPGTGFEHALEGKLYRMAAGLTAKTVNDALGPIVNDGTNYDIDTGANGTVRLGDIQQAGNATRIEINDTDGEILTVGALILGGVLATYNSESATVAVGTLSKKLAIYDQNQDLLGYIPIYGSIT